MPAEQVGKVRKRVSQIELTRILVSHVIKHYSD